MTKSSAYDTSNTASDVWADSAYRSQEIEEKLGRRGLKSRIRLGFSAGDVQLGGKVTASPVGKSLVPL